MKMGIAYLTKKEAAVYLVVVLPWLFCYIKKARPKRVLFTIQN
ncbi:hypothetical protein SAMN04487864_1055 [Succiniclasticum ruminis]|uniref:Uncharacterized protein n=1 Tax=Succiniclasticum ruminis TaxID=40841 RepID=A0A1G6KML4_9FIRM|nr:hypothetical protein SAMN04487864_1055 [Succiniclasticum ruminis]